MLRILSALLPLLLLGMIAAARAAEPADSVLTYHGHADRSGNLVVPALSWERARTLHRDANFQPQIAGHVYAQPLYWRPSGAQAGLLLVATEDDVVYALDAATGSTVWQRSLGRPVPRAALPCGNIDPLGITGTPVIDAASRTLYVGAMVSDPRTAAPTHEIFALSLEDGSVLPGWPINTAKALAATGGGFEARFQNQRGALTILGDRVYVAYSGHWGDCGRYRGWVVGAKLRDPTSIVSWHTRGYGGGIWAPAGISSDGHALFVATGNTLDSTSWSDGEAVIRLTPDLAFSGKPADFFAPRDWRQLDDRDADLGGTAPLPFDLPGGGANAALVLALGKDGKAYLLDRRNLGGIGGSLVAKEVSSRQIRTAVAAYPAKDGVFVAFRSPGSNCPRPGGGDLTVLKIGPGTPPALATAWCGAVDGTGSPMATTTDGTANPIVWIVGAEGDNRLHGFRGDTGEPLFTSDALAGLRRFQTLIATQDRLYVAADGKVYAFAF